MNHVVLPLPRLKNKRNNELPVSPSKTEAGFSLSKV
jgi:hypothetical protein